MWRGVGGVGKAPLPSHLGRPPAVWSQEALPGQVHGASGTPTSFCISFLAGGFSSVWGKIKEVREGQGLDLEASEITKKPKPRGGNPLLLWGVTVTLEMAGKLPVKYLK